ncbi:MAG: hypothetical protein R3C30_16270 [Hyphomonadaceae bacterium]
MPEVLRDGRDRSNVVWLAKSLTGLPDPFKPLPVSSARDLPSPITVD